MKRLMRFVRTTVLGGVAVILPIAVLTLAFGWVYRTVTMLIQPLAAERRPPTMLISPPTREITSPAETLKVLCASESSPGLALRNPNALGGAEGKTVALKSVA